MSSALSVYERGLHGGEVTHLVRPCGTRQSLPVTTWIGAISSADQALLAGCTGPTLDIGCGPGRLTTALTLSGVTSLGIDVSAVAVRMTTRRGGMALRRNVFDEVPGSGRWQHLLLADGNIGIGGDPVVLLRRCTELMASHGDLRLDLEPPGSGLLTERIRLESAGSISSSFRWAWLGVDALFGVAASAGLAVDDVWRSDSRWQARLVRARRSDAQAVPHLARSMRLGKHQIDREAIVASCQQRIGDDRSDQIHGAVLTKVAEPGR